MTEEIKETKEFKFGNWVREHARGIAITGVFGISGLIGGGFLGYTANENLQQKKTLTGVLEKEVQQDSKKEVRDIKKEPKETIQDKYTKTLEELNVVLKSREQLIAQQKGLINQIADANGVAVKLTAENSKLSRGYIEYSEKSKKLDASLAETTKKLEEADKKYLGLEKEKAGLEKGIIETTKELNKTLRDYNKLLMQKESYKPETGAQRTTGEESRLEEELGSNLAYHQIQTIRDTKGLSIVFLKGDLSEIDRKESDFYEETGQYKTKDLAERSVKEPGRYALLADANNDGIEDILYKRRTGIALKEGKKDGAFAPAKTISSKSSEEIQKKYILKGLGF
ncbi:MAG: hypothetical protein Q8N63_09125 [Nanoarchaeota archaeon]|nr:hypothetical protein [Nanoarchaeota archaeon]